MYRLSCPLTAVFPLHYKPVSRCHQAPDPPRIEELEPPTTLAWDRGTVRTPLEPYVALSVPTPLFVLREETLTKVIRNGGGAPRAGGA